MKNSVYVKNKLFRIPGSTTRSCIGPSITLGILESIWSPYLVMDEDGDGLEIDVIEGNFGVTKIVSKEHIKRTLKRMWKQNGVDHCSLAYPGNLFNAAFDAMIKDDSLSVVEAAESAKLAAEHTNFHGDLVENMKTEYERIMEEAQTEIMENPRDIAEKYDADAITEEKKDGQDTNLPWKQHDNLMTINGVDDEIELSLREHGYHTFEDIAEADPMDLADKVPGIDMDTAPSICQGASIRYANSLSLQTSG